MSEPYQLHPFGPTQELIHDRPGKIGIRLHFLHAGMSVPGHVHAFEHWMRMLSGVLRVEANGVEHILRAGEEMLVPAHVAHGLTSLASNTVAECEHDIREANGVLMPEAFAPDGVPIEWVRRLTVRA